MTNRVVAMENKLSQTEQYLAEANQHVEQLERELRRALIGLRTVRPCVEVYRDKYDYTVGTAMLSDLAARGIEVSERTLRERARQIGAYRTLGNAIDRSSEGS